MYPPLLYSQADKKRQKEEAEARAVAEAKRLIENPNQPLDQSTAPKPEEDVAEIKRRVKERNETVRKAEEANAIRVEPLGLDRRHNRYWRFSGERVPGGDTTKGRIYLERGDTGELQYVCGGKWVLVESEYFCVSQPWWCAICPCRHTCMHNIIPLITPSSGCWTPQRH